MMTTKDLDAFFEAGWNAHDVDLLMTFMSDDCVFESIAGPVRRVHVPRRQDRGEELVLQEPDGIVTIR